ncbi:MAG: sulfatase-like hydrolase/transferase, partial [Armatimonadota bacterium]
MGDVRDRGLRRLLSAMAGGAALSLWRLDLTRAQVGSSRPNILIYIADDQYTASVGCYGAEPSHTPNIDRLAREGTRFSHAFTPSSICTPSRGALLSGMYPIRNGAHPNHSGFKDGVRSLPNYMAELGYHAGLVGKDGIQRPSDLYEWE